MWHAHLSAQTQHFLANCNSEELEKMLVIIKPRIAAFKSMTTQKSSGGITKRSSATRKASNTSANAAKRSLNSWMAFRVYYSPIFHSHQQKDISGYLRKLWSADPFQANWAILAKAYSIIRDHKGKAFAPLDVFLSHACPHIGIIMSKEYLSRLGWSLVVEDGCKMLRRTSVPSLSSETKNLSVQDIIDFCHQMGFIDVSYDTIISSGSAPSASMTSQTLAPSSFRTLTATPQSDEDAANNVVSSNSVMADDQYASSGATPTTNTQSLPTFEDIVYGGHSYTDQLIPGRDDLPIFHPQKGDTFDAFNVSAFDNFYPKAIDFDFNAFLNDDATFDEELSRV